MKCNRWRLPRQFFRLFLSLRSSCNLRVVSVLAVFGSRCDRFVSRECHQPMSYKRRSSVRPFALCRPTTSVAYVVNGRHVMFGCVVSVTAEMKFFGRRDSVTCSNTSGMSIISVLSASFYARRRSGSSVFTAKNPFLRVQNLYQNEPKNLPNALYTRRLATPYTSSFWASPY